jgi:hypothetical protein
MSTRCPGCLAPIEVGDVEWWGRCGHTQRLVRPATDFAAMLDAGVPCSSCPSGTRLLDLRVRGCGCRLPNTLLDDDARIRKAFSLVIGIGPNSRSAADNAAALLVWKMRGAPLPKARSWIYDNEEARRIWELDNLGVNVSNRFTSEPLLLAVIDAATRRALGQAVLMVRWFQGEGADLAAWFTVPNCLHTKASPGERLWSTHQIVLAVMAEDLRSEAGRKRVAQHAGALAATLGLNSSGLLARKHSPRFHLLLMDQDRRLLRDLGPDTVTPEFCAENGGAAAWQPIGRGYVLENLRLGELLQANGLDPVRLPQGLEPLYGSMPVGANPHALLGIEAWSENLLSLLGAEGG